MVRNVLNRTKTWIKFFSDFYFSSNHRKLGWFFQKNDTKMTITRKIKIVKIWKLVLLSSQPISNLPCKFQKFQKKKILLRCSVATLFRSWLASLAVGLRTLVSLVPAQRHSRIACYIVFRHRKMFRKIKFASLFYSYVVSELARFARGRIEDSSLTGSRSTAFQNCLPHCFLA